MSRATSCFDLFLAFGNAVMLSSVRLGYPVPEDTQSRVWLAICDDHRARHHEQQRGSAGVKKSRPVVANELTIVKSCKRKVRW